jgi:predicted metal-dependent HD superfamily phosphohydrolase
MFEQIFKSELQSVSADELLNERLWTEIRAAYNQSTRHYHNLLHLDNLVAELLPVRNQINEWQVIVFSIAYHDIVYNTLKQDNEEKSARLAMKHLAELQFPSHKKEKCRQQILYTKGHQVSDDPDTNYFTDADLSILGHDSNDYLDYARKIRKEYKLYPDLLYNPGRRKVLAAFLAMKTIFKTKHFADKYEERARTNISAELALLS